MPLYVYVTLKSVGVPMTEAPVLDACLRIASCSSSPGCLISIDTATFDRSSGANVFTICAISSAADGRV
ncbi:hypothetical protein OMP38_18060 [Cohnella ginsengisoli]|uniref:Uncharacterized protein n=1 Tax=Cohnella ginsengisoli TaxID=425004 RepID=A0A9X4KID4_9BACL|nr:hypothetical protein [Cohnella ginsengisoli]MDG0792566.1 hypothetical protein [Cohnella ginsengisoli]